MNVPKIEVELFVKDFSEKIKASLIKHLTKCLKKLDASLVVKLRVVEPDTRDLEKTRCQFFIYCDTWLTIGQVSDRFGNVWLRGPSRTIGEKIEWDVQLSNQGKKQLGWASKSGNHINISLKGRITH